MEGTDTIVQLSEELVARLSEISSRLKYPVDAEIIYEGHTPIVGILLVAGRIKLVRGRRVRQVLERGALLGVPELLEKKAFEYTAQIQGGSEICYLDQSTIQEILRSDDEELISLFQGLIEATA